MNEHKDLTQTSAGAELTRVLRKQAERHDEEIRRLHAEMEDAVHAKNESRKELQAEVDKKREEVERIQRDVERMAADFQAEKTRLESRIAEIEAENRRYLDNMQHLQEQVVEARKQVESMQIERARRESELLAAQDEGAQRMSILEGIGMGKVEAKRGETREEQGEMIRPPSDGNTTLSTGSEQQNATREEEQSRQLAEDIVFIVDYVTKSILPRPIETRLKAMILQMAQSAREAASGDGFFHTYFAR